MKYSKEQIETSIAGLEEWIAERHADLSNNKRIVAKAEAGEIDDHVFAQLSAGLTVPQAQLKVDEEEKLLATFTAQIARMCAQMNAADVLVAEMARLQGLVTEMLNPGSGSA
ncbi:MAG TPA: hypothetical protein VHZ09_03715 [Acidobacteriaceae bacterium]|jgi:hypothetical protein|nr:hypothetical protein [Acidobacteriaceae bacterium]